jgi:hypothetical protein
VDVMHIKARVLSQAIWKAKDIVMVEIADKKQMQVPSAWFELRTLVNAKNVKNARNTVSEIIAGSVAWR